MSVITIHFMVDRERQEETLAVPMLLPVRPRPMPGEAAIGYLMRVAKANGHASPRHLWHGLKSEARLYEALELTAREQACLFGPLPGYWETGTENSGQKGNSICKAGGDQKLSGLSLAAFNHARMRWCPLCLMDSNQRPWCLADEAVLRLHGTQDRFARTMS